MDYSKIGTFEIGRCYIAQHQVINWHLLLFLIAEAEVLIQV